MSSCNGGEHNVKEEVFSDRPDLKTYFWVDLAKRGEDRCVEVRVSVENTEVFKSFIDTFKKLQKENIELKRKLEICESYLKSVGDCCMCIHAARESIECEDNCKFEVRYE